MGAAVFSPIGRQGDKPPVEVDFGPVQPRDLACSLAGKDQQFDDGAIIAGPDRVPDGGELVSVSTRCRVCSFRGSVLMTGFWSCSPLRIAQENMAERLVRARLAETAPRSLAMVSKRSAIRLRSTADAGSA